MMTIIGGRPPGRNHPCPCGSGIKFKKCHGDSVKISKASQQAETLDEAAKLVDDMVIKQRYDNLNNKEKKV